MTDKKILEEVYRRLAKQTFKDKTVDHLFDRWRDIKGFIEQEWQKSDEERQDHGLEGSSYDMRVN